MLDKRALYCAGLYIYRDNIEPLYEVIDTNLFDLPIQADSARRTTNNCRYIGYLYCDTKRLKFNGAGTAVNCRRDWC